MFTDYLFDDNSTKIGEPFKIAMYTLWALQGIGWPMSRCEYTAEAYRYLVFMVQLLGPGLLVVYQADTDQWKSTTDLDLYSPVHVLAVLLLLLLGIYSSVTLCSDFERLAKVAELMPLLTNPNRFPLRYSLVINSEVACTQKMGWSSDSSVGIALPCMFWIGAMMNIYVINIGLVVTLLNFLSAGNPVDLIFNSVAFSFMQRLDEPDGDFGLGVVSEAEWSSVWMGHLWTLNCSDHAELSPALKPYCVDTMDRASYDAYYVAWVLCAHDLATLDGAYHDGLESRRALRQTVALSSCCGGLYCALVFFKIAVLASKLIAIALPAAYVFFVYTMHEDAQQAA